MIGAYLYGILILISLILLGVTYRKSGNRLTFALYLALVGSTLLFDYIIFVWGKAYIYAPHILNNKYDTHIGAIASDVFSIPATATFVAVFNLTWPWMAGLGILYFGIEELFIKLEIYKHFWWKTSYTFIAMLLLLGVAKVWFRNLNKAHGRLLSFVTLVAILSAIRSTFSIVSYSILETRQFTVPWIEALGRDSTAVNTLIILPSMAIFSFLILYNYRIFWKITVITLFFLFDLLLRKLNIVHSLTPWDNLYVIAADIATFLLGVYFKSILQKNT